MNFPSTLWRFVVILLIFFFKCCPLLPAGCHHFNSRGYLTVKPASYFLIGSNLTVYCHITECQWSFKIALELNGETVSSWKRVNCTTTKFSLFNVRTPRSIVRCKRKIDQLSEIVNGLDLHGGLPPDKPENIFCETSRSSESIDCSWERGQETHLPTTYNISVNRENGTQVLLDQIQNAEEITIPRTMLDENTTYQMNISVYNQFGESQSPPFILRVNDIMIPETPHIMQIKFEKNSIAAMLLWKTYESSMHLRSDVRLRTDNGSWEVGEVTELNSEGLIQVDGLRPLTEYEFKMRTCKSPSGLTHSNTPRSNSSKRSLCSKWSPSVRGSSPGKGPSQQLQVWRMFVSPETNGLTVLWKPLAPEDYSGAVQEYKIFLGSDQQQEVTCGAAVSQCSVELPAEVQALSVSAVTLYGMSPLADVPLRHSGEFGPALRELAPSANGSAVFVSWSRLRNRSTSGGYLLQYVLEWTSVLMAELQWKKVTKDQNSTFITGLTAGVRYNVSLYAVTTRGVSVPSSGLVYCREQKPVAGPNMSVLVHKARRIRIQWDELPVEKQRGFITSYTIYLQTLDSSSTKLSKTVTGSSPRQMWLDCPEGALALQLTASTSAGEGKRGNRICSQPESQAVGVMIVTVFIVTFLIAVIANLMCWSGVRERIKQKCISWGPAWLDENLPKPGNSNAIRLLEQYGSEPSFSSTHSDPPLSPISLISQEESDDVYPIINVPVSQVVTGPTGPTTVTTPLLMSHLETMLVDSHMVEHVGYKPQIVMQGPQGEEIMETDEDQRDVTSSGEEEGCVFRGLLGDFLSNVEVDFTDPPLGLTLSSVRGVSWPKTPETTSISSGGFLLGRIGTENDVELQQGEIMIADTADTCLSLCTIETTLASGYFPQAAAVNSTAFCGAQR